METLQTETISKRLQKLRLKRGLTIKEVATKIGIPATTYRDWEYGSAIQGEPYLKLAEAFEISLHELLGQPVSTSAQEVFEALQAIKTHITTLEKDLYALL